MIDDIVRGGQSILLLGKPGIGKTTKLRGGRPAFVAPTRSENGS